MENLDQDIGLLSNVYLSRCGRRDAKSNKTPHGARGSISGFDYGHALCSLIFDFLVCMGNRGIDPFHSPGGMKGEGEISEAFHERTRGGEGLKAIWYGARLKWERDCCILTAFGGRNFRARTALGVGIVAADSNLRYV